MFYSWVLELENGFVAVNFISNDCHSFLSLPVEFTLIGNEWRMEQKKNIDNPI